MSDDEVEGRAVTGAAEDAAGEPALTPKLSSIPPPPLNLSADEDVGWDAVVSSGGAAAEASPEIARARTASQPDFVSVPEDGAGAALPKPSRESFDEVTATSAAPVASSSSAPPPPSSSGLIPPPKPPRASVSTPPKRPAPLPNLRPPPPQSAPAPAIEVGEVEEVVVVEERPARSVQPMRIISIGAKPHSASRPATPSTVREPAPPTVHRSSYPAPVPHEGAFESQSVAADPRAQPAPQLRDVAAFSGAIPAPAGVPAGLEIAAPPVVALEDLGEEAAEELDVAPEAEETLSEPVPFIAPVRSKPPPPPRHRQTQPQEDLDIEISISEDEEVLESAELTPSGAPNEIAATAPVTATDELAAGEEVSSVEEVSVPEEDVVSEDVVPEEVASSAQKIEGGEETSAAEEISSPEEIAPAEEEIAAAEIAAAEEIAAPESVEPEVADSPLQEVVQTESQAVPTEAVEELDEGDIRADSDQFSIPQPAAKPPAPPAVIEPVPEAPKPPAEAPTAEDKAKKLAPPAPPKRRRPPPPPSERLVAAALEPAKFELAKKPRVRPWWEELFTEEFSRSFVGLTDAQIKREANFIEDSLGVAKGGVILDLACGVGQHAVELSKRGYGVVGLDLSVLQLAIAGEHAQERGQKINFVQGDMRDMVFEEMFDGVYCWNTSFGYFEEDKNVHVAENVFRALRPGGSFLLDVVNRDFVVEQQPSSVWFEGDACVCMDDMSVDFITSRLRVKRTMMLDDGRTKECSYSIRMYGLHELGKMLHAIGFRVTEASGHRALPGVFMGATSPRIIILAQKPDGSG